MKEYFLKKEYMYMYLAKYFYTVANSLVDIFGAVMLYKDGMDLPTIFLLFGFKFGLMGLITPFFMKISSKFGIITCAVIANSLRFLSTYLIFQNGNQNFWVLVILLGIPGGISNPIGNAISSKYVENKHRGKYNSLVNIMRILGQATASILVAYGITSSNLNMLLIITGFCFFMDCIFTSLVNYKPKEKNCHIYREAFQFMFFKKNNLKTIAILRSTQIVERILLPLYLYIILKDFVAFATVITISLLIQAVFLVLTGKAIDHDIKRTSKIMTILKIFLSAIFIVIKSKFILSINKMASDNVEKMYETLIGVVVQNKIKKSKREDAFLAMMYEMCLCFAEIIFLSILAICSIYLKENTFIIIFGLSILSVIGIHLLIISKKR